MLLRFDMMIMTKLFIICVFINRGLNSLKNYQGPAAALINTLFGGQTFSSATISLPPILLGYNSDLVWFNKNLDNSQKEAVEFALKQREVAVVHGPPGTGQFMFCWLTYY
jgi:ATP-dependent RNA/DNA helicase IGHMBP2